MYIYIYIYIYTRVGNGNLLQYSCLENPMDKGAWQATVHGVAKSPDMTEHLQHIYIYIYIHTHTHIKFNITHTVA